MSAPRTARPTAGRAPGGRARPGTGALRDFRACDRSECAD